MLMNEVQFVVQCTSRAAVCHVGVKPLEATGLRVKDGCLVDPEAASSKTAPEKCKEMVLITAAMDTTQLFGKRQGAESMGTRQTNETITE
ncbi:hypothetical protein NDU88_000437 [Pleurodeles waltl]|uniref:Uncharacterized protein n=1 Tax=Pleurodeles waltl TaxID=8319 RepID=A0AAV7URB0_PLEWA|nr:hypothetical protein NDU88_000437 [Pleurodeles waltl]